MNDSSKPSRERGRPRLTPEPNVGDHVEVDGIVHLVSVRYVLHWNTFCEQVTTVIVHNYKLQVHATSAALSCLWCIAQRTGYIRR